MAAISAMTAPEETVWSETTLPSLGLPLTTFPDVSPKEMRPFRSRRNGRQGPSTGLRAVTMAVVNQLKNRQVCSYRDIASLIVQNFDPSASHREKNSIRRRAYDVINVMSAVGIVRKKKKRFFTVESFIGVDVRDLERKRDEVVKRMKEKEMELNDMLIILEEENAKSAMKPALNFKMKHQEDKENIPILRVKEEPLDDVQAVIVEPVNQNKLSFCHQRSSLLELDKSQCESNPNTSQDLIVVDPNIHAFTRYHDDYEDQDEYFDCEVEVQSEEKPNIDLTVQEAFTSFY